MIAALIISVGYFTAGVLVLGWQIDMISRRAEQLEREIAWLAGRKGGAL